MLTGVSAGACPRVGAAVLIGLVALLGAMHVEDAGASTYTPEDLTTIREHAYRGGAVTGTPPACGAACSDLRLAETRPIPNQPTSAQLHAELRTYRTRLGLLRPLSAIGSISLGVGVFEVGWRIGTEVRKLIGIATPENPTTSGPCHFSWSLRWIANLGDKLGFGPHRAGFLLSRYGGAGCGGTYQKFSGSAVAAIDAIAGSMRHIVAQHTCYNPPDPKPCHAYYWFLEDVVQQRAIEDVEPGANPSVGATLGEVADPALTDQQAADELLSTNPFTGQARYPVLNQQYRFQLGVPNACDPLEPNVCNPPIQRELQRRCNLGDGGNGADPDPVRTSEPFDPALYEVRDPFTRRTAHGGQASTALKFGWTRPLSTKREWDGWGWRHVAAKHGWRADDVAATAAALQAPPIEEESSDALVYLGPEYERNGAFCRRRVVVGPTALPGGEPEPKEIITSYGEYLADAP